MSPEGRKVSPEGRGGPLRTADGGPLMGEPETVDRSPRKPSMRTLTTIVGGPTGPALLALPLSGISPGTAEEAVCGQYRRPRSAQPRSKLGYITQQIIHRSEPSTDSHRWPAGLYHEPGNGGRLSGGGHRSSGAVVNVMTPTWSK